MLPTVYLMDGWAASTSGSSSTAAVEAETVNFSDYWKALPYVRSPFFTDGNAVRATLCQSHAE